jgi:hypothetical protein
MHLTKCNSNFANSPFRLDEESSATEVPTEMVQTPLAPPSSPKFSPSECFVTLSDVQELVKGVMDMQMPSSHTSKCTCSHTPPEDPSEMTSIGLCSPTHSHMFPTNQSSGHITATEHVQQLFDTLKSLSTRQGLPLNSLDLVRVPEGAKLDAPEDSQPDTAPAGVQPS